ncbi:hypothetical protein Mal64_16140 [Pseudobythopirellula maris]|uniref:Transcription termination/antitermination protein NusG n=1 Tax=Pseudobythopirellula maris TaxID=2527991 RepID=A0A5C5ZL31_9BACT|nr:transcription termination/antitermination protein NusG [Pseudobythopirellula maris]TWT88142.1 hypothetical protein Mal64_16140 [Pseudobythopirellula maris]
MSEEVAKDEKLETDAPAAPAPEGDASRAEGDAPADQQAAQAPATEQAEAEESAADQGESEGDLTDVSSTDSPSSVPGLTAQELEDLNAAEEAMEIDEEPPAVAPAGPIEMDDDDEEEIRHDWYILKVQSNRERTSAVALKRKVAIEGIDHLFGEIIVPTEKVTEFKNGKKKIVERKIWPGYIAVQMHVNDDTWFAIRETAGIGDFTGASGKPAPMQPHEIAMILHQEEEETEDTPKLNIKFAVGDKVKVKDGNFENFEGDVDSIDPQSGKVTVMISIFGRSTPVELEYWQVETL